MADGSDTSTISLQPSALLVLLFVFLFLRFARREIVDVRQLDVRRIVVEREGASRGLQRNRTPRPLRIFLALLRPAAALRLRVGAKVAVPCRRRRAARLERALA